MIYLITGNEPYMIWATKNKARKEIVCPEMDLLETDSVTSENTLDFISSYPFMSEKKCVIANIAGMAELDVKSFYDMLEHNPEFVDIYIYPEKTEKNRKAYKALAKKKCIITMDKVKPAELNKFIDEFLKKESCTISKEAKDLFIKKLNYYDNDDVSLFSVINELQKLICVSKDISITDIEVQIVSNEVDNVFALSRLIREGNVDAVFHELELLSCKKDYSPIGVLSLLLREYRIAWKKATVYNDKEAFSEISSERSVFCGMSVKKLKESMLYITDFIADIKGGVQNADAIKSVLLRLVLIVE